MYARQHTALRCYLRRLLGCFRHSGAASGPNIDALFVKRYACTQFLELH